MKSYLCLERKKVTGCLFRPGVYLYYTTLFGEKSLEKDRANPKKAGEAAHPAKNVLSSFNLYTNDDGTQVRFFCFGYILGTRSKKQTVDK